MVEENNKIQTFINNFYKHIDTFFFVEYIEKNIVMTACGDPECKCIEEWEDATTEQKIEVWYTNLKSLDERLFYINKYTEYNNMSKDAIGDTLLELQEKLAEYEEKPPMYESSDES